MSKITLQNNPVVNAKKRYWLLERRKKRLSAFRRIKVEYEGGEAARIYINTDPRVRKAGKLRSAMTDEQTEIARWLHKHGYTLA